MKLYVDAILWATAILAAAIVGAPVFLTVLLLPCLAIIAILPGLKSVDSRCCARMRVLNKAH